MKKVFILLLGIAVLGACTAVAPRPQKAKPMPTVESFVNGGDCPVVESAGLGGRAGCVSKVGGTSESVTVYAIVGRELSPKRWRIRYESGTTVSDRPLDAGNPFSYPRAIASIDVGDDGTNEWLIKAVDLAGHGTNWQRLQLFVVSGDSLEPVNVEGEPFYVNVGGTSRMGEGARCDGKYFVLLRAEAETRDNRVWSFSERMYAIEGTKAKFIDRRSGELHLSDYNDPQLNPYYQATCGSFVHP